MIAMSDANKLPIIRLDIRNLLAEWVKTEFPHLETFTPMSTSHFFVIKKQRKCGSQGAIVAVVLDVNREMFEDMLGCLMKKGIWTLSEKWRWETHYDVIVESPDFFDTFARIIKQEDLIW